MKILKLESDIAGKFIDRPNRFVAEIKINGSIVKAHVHDSGRLSELLYKGNEILLRKAKNKNRKTNWDVIAAKRNTSWVLINTMFHRKIFLNYIKKDELFPFIKIKNIVPEYTYNKSRLDFLIKKNKKKIFVETKGVTLIKNRTAVFPDAPTKRGKKHIEELIEIVKSGNRAALFFLIFLEKSTHFMPNEKTDKEFSKLFYKARKEGVKIYKPVFGYDGKYVRYIKSI